MNPRNGPPSPESPTIEPSEPEVEHRMFESAMDSLLDESCRRFIGLNNIRDYLRAADLDVDEDGFIIETDTGEHATPYAYDSYAFREIESPVDDPTDTYYRPEEDVDICILSKGILHLRDLHTVTYVGGEPRPVRDDEMPIRQMIGETGIAFSVVTMWSDATHIVDFPGPDVHINHPGMSDHSLTMTCLKCEFTGEPDDWGGEETAPCCPECSGPWDSRGLEICTACETTHWWDNIDHGGRYDTPKCPDCGGGYESLESHTYYDRADSVPAHETDYEDDWEISDQ